MSMPRTLPILEMLVEIVRGGKLLTIWLAELHCHDFKISLAFSINRKATTSYNFIGLHCHDFNMTMSKCVTDYSLQHDDE